MTRRRETYYIYRNLVSRKLNNVTNAIHRILFNRYDFDPESIEHLKDSASGHPVYVSFQSSNTALMILLNLLKRHGLAIPTVALDFRTGIVIKTINLFQKFFLKIAEFLNPTESEHDQTFDFLSDSIEERLPVAISILSGKLFQKRYMNITIDSLQYLIEIQMTMKEPIILYPHIMFWNRIPEKSSGLRLLQATDDRGFLMALATSFKRVAWGFVRISKGINLQEKIAELKSNEPEKLARDIRNLLLDVYTDEKRSVLGPVSKNRQEMMEKVLFNTNVMIVIQQEVEKTRKPLPRIRKKAYTYYTEIAATMSVYYIQFLATILTRIFTKIFDGIHYDPNLITRLREAGKKGPLILMPNHKSHMDYLILSYLLYMNNIMPPHIVAGVNLSFFPMGTIFRNSGAFFMRRSFKGNALYTVIFKQYVKALVNEGFSIEYFIEGGRTRTGKLNFPMMGITKYLVEAIEEGYNRDMIFVPIAINYDRILEESSYHNELKGQTKKKETTGALVKSRKLLNRTYGSVYVAMDEPVSFQEIKDRASDTVGRTKLIADLVTKNINHVMIVTPFSLVTTALLLLPSRGFTVSMLREKVLLLKKYLVYTGATLADTIKGDESLDEMIFYVLDSYNNDSIIRPVEAAPGLPSDDEKIFVIDTESRGRINFTKNTIMHLLLPLSLLSLTLLTEEDPSDKKLRKNFHALKELFSHEFVYTDFICDDEKSFSATLKYLVGEKFVKTSRKGAVINGEEAVSAVRFFATIIRDYLEAYLTASQTIRGMGKGETAVKKNLIETIRKSALRKFHLGEIRQSESISVPVYQNALNHFIAVGICGESSSDPKKNSITLLQPDELAHIIEKLQRDLKKLRQE